MASLIKSQIIKNLARYTKNLSADNVNLSLFKGEGEFLNLQLDENVLHSVLHMPQWLRIEKVTCNRVSWKIPWTKLKTEAIAIKFDAIYVEISAIGPNDKPNSSVQLANTTSTKYGFIDKVIDSICFSINSVDIKFGSPGFQALLHASRIQLRSTNPLWQVADLRSTRIVHDKSDQVIFFKEVLLSAIKLEASVTAGCEDKPTPLRLITSHSSLKITVKKRISDSGIICGKLELVLDDILWVLSEKQLKASVAFVKSVVDIMRQSHEHTRNTTKDDKQTTGSTNSEKNPMKYDLETPYAQSPVNMSDKPIDRLFWRYNVLETSFHIVTSRIDFHFCGGLQSRRDSSTMQVLLDRLSLDYYPEHIAGATRQHWQKHDNISLSRSTWSHQLLTSFFDNNPHLNGYKKFLFEGALLMR
ncbi:uncharacterized protein TRIADDRAFT_32779 [Trichoplax adhaerens]|uniref:Uncharacterized protein n=1 Tax=Trichoplax adhaerens TaxID=10228 RepID=B3SBL2_TRIAD|nr:hypothetical protein TRIADDRAFT_32779 [Trichoplax adhaerens]EDV19878.1 hypothetical protein TRIADDRAFT_32779 [Trichoplax adhaerens]|eukprot:XP_002117620.1 hypothetical protein TRIADDRAFT_32779 [Trichoplax adhaerens]